jgi:hypothetical protein
MPLSKSVKLITKNRNRGISYKLEKRFPSVYEMLEEIDMIPLMIAFSGFVD